MIDEMVKLGLIANQIDNRIEVVPFGPQDYANPYDPLATEIRATASPSPESLILNPEPSYVLLYF